MDLDLVIAKSAGVTDLRTTEMVRSGKPRTLVARTHLRAWKGYEVWAHTCPVDTDCCKWQSRLKRLNTETVNKSFQVPFAKNILCQDRQVNHIFTSWK